MGIRKPTRTGRRATVAVTVAVAVACWLAPGAIGLGRPAVAAAIQIMPLGDSITEGYSNTVVVPGGYRSTLYRDLTSAGYDVQFVGSQTTNPDPSLPAAANSHEGHIGYIISGDGTYSGFAASHYIGQWLAPGNGVNPSFVLLELGTNEIAGNYHVEQAPYELGALIARISELRPNATILVTPITPLAIAAHESEVRAFNAALEGPDGVVAQLQKQGVKVDLVHAGDQLSVSDLNSFGTHPTAEGYAKLGNAWYQGILPYLPPRDARPAPEPSTSVALAAGLLGLLALGRTRKSRP